MVVDRPVDEDVDSALMPDEADVEREETLLLVVESPVDAEVESEETLLFVVESPEDADVDSEPT